MEVIFCNGHLLVCWYMLIKLSVVLVSTCGKDNTCCNQGNAYWVALSYKTVRLIFKWLTTYQGISGLQLIMALLKPKRKKLVTDNEHMRVDIIFIWKRLYKRFYAYVVSQTVLLNGPIAVISTNLHNILLIFSLVHFGMCYTLNIILPPFYLKLHE